MSDKIKSIEMSAAKNRIRIEIANQVTCFASKLTIPEQFKGLTLPAESWFFENILKDMFEKQIGTNKLTIDGVEQDYKVALKSLVNMPEGFHLAKCSFDEFIKFKSKPSKSGVNYMTKEPSKEGPDYDFVWADYCSNAHHNDIDQLVNIAQNHMPFGGLLYATFCVKSRAKGNNYIEYAKRFRSKKYRVNTKNNDSTEVTKAVTEFINQELNKIPEKTAKMIYNVLYHGGHSCRTPMVTVGFLIGSIYAQEETFTITPIVDVRRDSKLKLRRWQTAFKLKGKKAWMARVTKGKLPSKNEDSPQLKAALYRYEKKWKGLTSEKKNKIANKYGLSHRQFASKIAWLHGKLAKKRV